MGRAGQPRQRALVAGAERDQVSMQPVRGPDPLAEQLPAPVAEQLQITGSEGELKTRQPLPCRHARDRQGVAEIALALTAEPPSLAVAERAADIADVLAGADEQARERVRDPTSALDPEPTRLRRERERPRLQ